MKISVVTIVYNDKDHIEETILSVINQDAAANIEYIIIDGKSSDGTSEIIKKYSCHINHYVCEADSGIYNAMNKGLRIASGDYAIFMNSGDKFDNISTVKDIIMAIGDQKPDVVYGNYSEIDEKKKSVIPCRHHSKIWYGPVTAHQSTLYRIEFLRENNFVYDESYKIAADYKLTAQSIKNAQSILKTDICISNFDTSGVSSTNKNLGLREANRVRKEVFKWGRSSILLITSVLFAARFAKQYLKPIYKHLRY